MPSGTDGPSCSSNATSFRTYLLEGFAYFEEDAEEDEKGLAQAEAYYNGISYLDEVGVDC
jgi:hypothetical protein